MVKIAPRKIKGQWVDGYALDLHTSSSDFIGYNEFGYPEFVTKYTEIGELLHRLKYKRDKTTIEEIVITVADFVKSKGWLLNMVIPVPPSNPVSFHPTLILAEKLAKFLDAEYCGDCIKKIKNTPQLKNVFDIDERKRLLSGAFRVDTSKIEGKSVLLFDDLYRSGATMGEVASALHQSDKITHIYALALTMTRRYR